MRRLLLIALLAGSVAGFSQSDTLFSSNRKKIPCKIYEISDFEIKYRIGMPDGPIVVTEKSNFYKYVLSNGYTELMIPDALLIENEHQAILNRTRVIKLQPFSLANNQVSLSYEQVIKTGTNLDVEAGYINSSITDYPLFGGSFSPGTYNSGFYIKPGIKFLLGPDNMTRGLKYAHPLKGNYVRLDLAFSMINFQGVQGYVYSPGVNGYSSTSYITSGNVSSYAYGGFVNYGRQTILGNLLTLDIYGGFGVTGQSNTYSNSSGNPFGNYSGYIDAKNIYNYHAFLRVPLVGLSFTAGFRIGFILPENSGKPKKIKTKN